jgi:hypothetical protein
MAKPPLYIPPSELAALDTLIDRLNASEILSREEARRRHKETFGAVFDRMTRTGETYGAASGSPSILNQGEDAFRQELRSINDKLGRQVEITHQFIDGWFERGDIVAPHWPWRITVILRKAKRFDLERKFLAAFTRHFNGPPFASFTDRAVKIGLDIDLAANPIGISDETARRVLAMPDQITFSCIDCGQSVPFDDGKPHEDSDIVTCDGCGRTFGTYAQVREAMIEEGKKVVDKMIDDANLPAWITRK